AVFGQAGQLQPRLLGHRRQLQAAVHPGEAVLQRELQLLGHRRVDAHQEADLPRRQRVGADDHQPALHVPGEGAVAGPRVDEEAGVVGVALEAAGAAVGDEVKADAAGLGGLDDGDPHDPGVPAAVAAFAPDVDGRLAHALADAGDEVGLVSADAAVALDVL